MKKSPGCAVCEPLESYPFKREKLLAALENGRILLAESTIESYVCDGCIKFHDLLNRVRQEKDERAAKARERHLFEQGELRRNPCPDCGNRYRDYHDFAVGHCAYCQYAPFNFVELIQKVAALGGSLSFVNRNADVVVLVIRAGQIHLEVPAEQIASGDSGCYGQLMRVCRKFSQAQEERHEFIRSLNKNSDEE